jgi:hypothetical protein
MVSVVKMETVIKDNTTEEQRSAARFFIEKKKTQCKETFPVYGRKCLSHKAVHMWIKKFSQGRSKFADNALPYAEVDVTTVKRLLCYGFRSSAKAMGQPYQC